MTHSKLGRAALVSLMLGSATIGCTPGARMAGVTAVSDTVPQRSATAARTAGKAQRALAGHDAESAVRWAERAVAASPNDADHRLLLGRAYLAAGRFASAEASLRDTLALAPDQPRAAFNLALTQIAIGAPAAAQATLATVKGRVPDADLGLALALAGNRAAGITVLTDLVRTGKSDARGRQNLALALALDGQPDQARGMAMQDTPPDRLEAKLAGWAAMAKQPAGAGQVAAMLGIAPAPADPGRPTALALAAPTAQVPVALALATPLAIAAAVPVSAPLRTVSLPIETAVPAPVMLAAAVPTPVMPTMLAAKPVPVNAAPLVRVAAAAPSRTPVAPGPLLQASAGAGFVVQLGAFSRAGAIDAAWSQAARLSPRFAGFTALRGSVQHLGGTLVRLSVGGFAARRDADGLCGEIRKRGGACFVRSALGDRPWQWARKDTGTQIAMRERLQA